MIIGLIEQNEGVVDKLSLEMVALGRRLAQGQGTALEGILFGEGAAAAASELAAYGVSKAHVVQHPRLARYAPAAWAECLVQLIGQSGPTAVLAAGSERGNELMAHTGARLGLPMAANCAEVAPGDPYRVTRFRWGGSLLEEAELSGEPKLLTVAPGAVSAEEAKGTGQTEIVQLSPSMSESDFRVQVTTMSGPAESGISLADARIVVGGGRGVGSAEGFETLQELAQLLNGAVGSSRVATNLGWRAHSDQIGQTGTRIAPDLYIACGVSGAIQHMVGCKGSKSVLSINIDREAPIIAKSNYAIIGDLHAVVPAIIAEIKKANAG